MPEAYEFDGIKFGPVMNDRIPSVDRDLVYGERHVPYSDKTIVDIGGYGPNRFSSTIRVGRMDVTSFRLRLGRTASLYIANVHYPHAVLIKLASHTMTPRQFFSPGPGWQLDGIYHYFEAEWIMGQLVAS